MKVWIIYLNQPWEYSHPFAVFSSKQKAETWIKNSDSDISHGIQELELDYSPKNWMEIHET